MSAAPSAEQSSPALPAGMRVLAVPGLPDDVQVRASSRRRRTVTAYRERGRTIVLVPARMPRAEIVGYVRDLVGRLEARDRRRRPSDTALAARAAELSRRYLDGAAGSVPAPASVRWVDNQQHRWGSCTPYDRTIRLSSRMCDMPDYVVDYVLLHELAHLLVPGHGPDFEALLVGYPRLLEARAFLAGVDHASARGGSLPEQAQPEPPQPEQSPESETDPQPEPPGARETLW